MRGGVRDDNNNYNNNYEIITITIITIITIIAIITIITMMSLMTVAGPGTGVSPFIGFLQHLEALKQQQQRALGHSFLFFGCRNSREFLFQQQLEHWAKGGVLAGLWVAFSRPGTEHCRNAADAALDDAPAPAADAAAAAGSIGTLSLSASFDETRSGQYVQHIIAQQKQVTRARLLAAAH